MTPPKFRLAEAPLLVLNEPDCSVCDVTVESDEDGWTCPNCGTSWSYDQGDGDAGELPEYDDPGLPLVDSEDAWKHAGEYSRLAEAVDAAKVGPETEPFGPQCLDLSDGFDLADVIAARDAARATKTRTRDVPLVVSPRDAALIAGTPAESGTVVSVEIAPPAPVPVFPRDPRRPSSPTSGFLSPRFTAPGVM